jgi:hypothetical protein
MSVLIGIVILGTFIWAVWAGYIRVLSIKRYGTRQNEVPDLKRFTDGSTTSESSVSHHGGAEGE